jgi:hypothetical protein
VMALTRSYSRKTGHRLPATRRRVDLEAEPLLCPTRRARSRCRSN